MKGAKGYIFSGVVIFSVLLATAVVLVNSVMDFEASHHLSGLVMKLFSLNGGAEGAADDFMLRKVAHLAEYALLGGAVMCLTLFCRKKYNKNIFVYSAVYVSAVAVLDEYIQSLSDRNGTLSDVFLDLLGVSIGFLTVWLINLIKNKKASG